MYKKSTYLAPSKGDMFQRVEFHLTYFYSGKPMKWIAYGLKHTGGLTTLATEDVWTTQHSALVALIGTLKREGYLPQDWYPNE